ncbi:uncharacterized protein EV422DRAFT_94775 [Fimicolochytrium jonesii]|uniref:uncharacterized protein n=1 Tax=Fimicolochytrium jonesii TaxID=1396493 RepID=UPI0022FE19C3|nr:uncharacterized protein EV422DRAFT_94775 [Fimicolochytrium jonesii]KAI8819993.1 hypothetical protein EV422DRAFT_94775 [Fimicolochytrium jonesii]
MVTPPDNRPDAVEAAILKQVEYILLTQEQKLKLSLRMTANPLSTDENLPKDKYLNEVLRLHQGWVPISVLRSFKKLKAIQSDSVRIAIALKKSDGMLEVDGTGKKVRRRTRISANAKGVDKEAQSKEGKRKTEDEQGERNSDETASKKRRQTQPTPSTTHPIPPATALDIFHTRHFSQSVKQTFFQNPIFGPLTSSTAAPIAHDADNYWSKLCTPCAEYWSNYYSQQQDTLDVTGVTDEMAPTEEDETWEADEDVTYEEDVTYDNEVAYDDDKDAAYDDETEPSYILTPGMIDMFRHPATWKIEKRRIAEEMEAKEAAGTFSPVSRAYPTYILPPQSHISAHSLILPARNSSIHSPIQPQHMHPRDPLRR